MNIPAVIVILIVFIAAEWMSIINSSKYEMKLEKGQKRLELWAKPDLHKTIKEYAQTLASRSDK